MNENKLSSKKLMTLSILFVSALEMGGMGLMPSLASIQASFPNAATTTVQTIASFPGFVMIFTCLLTAVLVKHISKKVLCLIGVACSASIGILGYLFNGSIAVLYVWATVLGVGFGFLMPTSNGIIADNYDESERGGIMGLQTIFTNCGGIYLTFVGGALATINWHMNYLAYLIGVIPLILGIFFLPSDNPKNRPVVVQQEKVGLSSLNRKTWLYGIIIFVFINAYNVFGTNVSFVIVERNLGNPGAAGTAMAIFLVGGVLGGLLFGRLTKNLRDYMFMLAFIALTVGYFIVYFAGSLAVVYIGAVVTGTSISFAMPQSLLSTTNCNKVAAVTSACAVIHICGQLGTVCSAFFFTPVAALFSKAADFRYCFAGIVCAVVALVIAVVVKASDKKSEIIPD